MSKQSVRVLVEERGEVHWYASFDADSDDLTLSVSQQGITVEGKNLDNVLTSFSTSVVLIDLACDLYATYIESCGGKNWQGQPCPPWNQLPSETRKHWIEVARRASKLGALYEAPAKKDATAETLRLHGYTFDMSDEG